MGVHEWGRRLGPGSDTSEDLSSGSRPEMVDRPAAAPSDRNGWHEAERPFGQGDVRLREGNVAGSRPF